MANNNARLYIRHPQYAASHTVIQIRHMLMIKVTTHSTKALPSTDTNPASFLACSNQAAALDVWGCLDKSLTHTLTICLCLRLPRWKTRTYLDDLLVFGADLMEDLHIP